jgi:hypothetical protein
VFKIYSIADIIFSLSWDPDIFPIVADSALAEFSVFSEDYGEKHISFTLSEYKPINLQLFTLVFNTVPDSLWRIWKKTNGDSYLISLHHIADGGGLFHYTVANHNFTEFNIFSDDRQGEYAPLRYPIDELAISGYLNINKVGIVLHSAMISMNGEGFLFSGTSGSGKSTLSGLWFKDQYSEVLTDERVIIREKNGTLYSFGTPWHGTAGIHKNRGAPLRKIFFIKHGKENSLRKISTLDAANRLIVRCFPTFWHRGGMQFALDFCSQIASGIECYEFGFVPDKTAIEFLKKAILS